MGKPEKQFKVGNSTASVFVNEVNTKNGKALIKSVSLQRTYKDKEGNFQSVTSFGIADVPKAILALEKAYEHMILQENGD